MPDRLTDLFPQLASDRFEITSPEDTKYNCIAWAAGPAEARRVWWPALSPFTYWPLEPREETLAGFIKAFAMFGYVVCENPDLEPGYEKLALYADDGENPTHMARQHPSGWWTSKLGDLQDIEHATLDQLNGPDYGRPVRFLKRELPSGN